MYDIFSPFSPPTRFNPVPRSLAVHMNRPVTWQGEEDAVVITVSETRYLCPKLVFGGMLLDGNIGQGKVTA
jgi:hypothetical protein